MAQSDPDVEGSEEGASDGSRTEYERLDRDDPLARLRSRFRLPPGVIYLDGNSLGPLPVDTVARVAEVVSDEWGEGLIGSWNTAGWIDAPKRVGRKIAQLIGVPGDDVVAADSTSVNLFKVLSAAVQLRPERRTILSERGNFPTDLYVTQGLIAQLGKNYRLELVDRDELPAALADGAIRADLAVALLTQVDYRTGSRLDLASTTRAVHSAGGLVLWDLCHSAGAFELDLAGCDADFAIGCGYKYLNGGPGAPAFLYVADRHQARFSQPLSGWMGHARPFDFVPGYEPAQGIGRYLCGTPSVIALAALEVGVDTLLEARPLGGLAALKAKADRLTDCFIDCLDDLEDEFGLTLVTPRDPALRGCQASYRLPDGAQAYAVVQALIARGVIGDFRAPDILRFGFAPLYLRYVDAWDAAEHLTEVLQTREWDQPKYLKRRAVT